MILRYHPNFTEHCMELVEGGEWVKVKDITQLLKWLEPTEDVVHNEALSELEESLK